MDRVLIVSGTEKSGRAFAQFLTSHGLNMPAEFAQTADDARRRAVQHAFRLILINAPLPDEFGHVLARDLAQKVPAGIVLAAKVDLYDRVCMRVAGSGVLVAAKPLNPMFFYQCICTSMMLCDRVQALQRENRRLQGQIHEAQVIGRAKCALVQYRHLTEEEAHHFIEKQAMDSRLPKIEVAEDILQTYEGL